MLVYLLLLFETKAVLTGDIIHFDLNSFLNPAPPSENLFHTMTRKKSDRKLSAPYAYNNRNNFNRLGEDLESEFGVFEKSDKVAGDNVYTDHRRPKFQTQKYIYGSSRNSTDKASFVQKIPKLPQSETKTKINQMLKSYLAKLYAQKYNAIKPKPDSVTINNYNDPDQESKFLDGSLWDFKNKTKFFANKFLSLFTVVQFPNSACLASSASGDYMGLCYHQTECDSMNGTALGNCASGYGVCCVFKYTCGGSSSQNCTYFESPGYPNYDPPGTIIIPPDTNTISPTTANPSPTPDPRLKYHYEQVRTRWARQADTTMSCYVNIYKINSNVQQMRIDFIDLELKGPTNGTCRDERLVISGQNLNDQIPVLCGYNSGQHVYVDVSQLSGPLQISVLSTTGERKRYRMRICQLSTACSNSNNCLQYYTGVTGTISSFNYDQTASYNRSVGGYFNNLNYAVCIRKEAGYCSVTYSNMPAGVEYPFQFRNVDDAGQNIVPPGQAGAEIFNCPDDYLVIGGLRLCGDKFNDGSFLEDFTRNAPVTDSSAGPIVIAVRTNEAVTGRGFKLFYTQNRCTAT